MNANSKSKFSPYEIDRLGINGELQKALDIALEQIRNGSHNSDLYYIGARIAFDLCNIPKAEQLTNLLLAAEPEHINGWILYGKINSLKGDRHRSEYGIKRAEEIFPGLAHVNILRELQKQQPAKKPMEKIEPQPVDEESFNTATFAEICVKQGYLNKALKIYIDMRTKNPANLDIDKRIEEIKRKIEKND